MKSHIDGLWILLLIVFAAASAPAVADDDDAKMMAQLTQIKKSCEQQQARAKRLEDEREQQLAAAISSASLPPEKIREVQQKIAIIKEDIAKTDEFLARPEPSTREERESYIKKALGAIAVTRERESVIAKDIGVDPSSRVEAVLGNLGAAEDFKTRRGAFDWEKPNSQNADAPVVAAGTTHFFGLAGQLPPSVIPASEVSSGYKPTAVDEATREANYDHGIGGGILLEGTAGGLDRVTSVDYDPGINALLLNGDTVYFVKISPWSLATMCREIGADRHALLGVTETETDGLVFGDNPEIYKGSELAVELFLADKFLGDIIFARPNAWTQGYKFPSTPPQDGKLKGQMIVRFALGDFVFGNTNGYLSVAKSSLEVRMMPFSKIPSPKGQMLPDFNAMDKGWSPPEGYVANAGMLSAHLDYFRHEAIIEAVFADGETAAILRSLKESNQDLNALADRIESSESQ